MSLRPAPVAAAACPVAATASRLERVLAVGDAHREAATAAPEKGPANRPDHPGWHSLAAKSMKPGSRKDAAMARLRVAVEAAEAKAAKRAKEAEEQMELPTTRSLYLLAVGSNTANAMRRKQFDFEDGSMWRVEFANYLGTAWSQKFRDILALQQRADERDVGDALRDEGYERSGPADGEWQLRTGTPQVLKNAQGRVVVVGYNEAIPEADRQPYMTFADWRGNSNDAFGTITNGRVSFSDGREIDGPRNWGFEDIIIAHQIWNALMPDTRKAFAQATYARNIYVMINKINTGFQ